ncbi:hypothetical protein FJV41_27470 [Myxococcus llanfairpwllgwyngyllgogerychwyrndrobwllllantysiliogogogochensis]|uniref:Uncharacterized protein n=1 Tax=Myxococcus llanfairpwllgwyngyllgogerychwyrndrobwllllantysiliogogogochensis TaxID=2590453 RepID=A0A540WWH3_9BACT|nr:hypothetical protein [Myxococcus llanfairpwllgwyngyllgogerychwyrndrobwllllantysiliogogogochensis]TQF12764.1 hypothetical protein FJV41_27470 [Myxococcus llanfairpwllgwyngyllgogerychwyrndrobwllllantysiliogogogochensis]
MRGAAALPVASHAHAGINWPRESRAGFPLGATAYSTMLQCPSADFIAGDTLKSELLTFVPQG